MHRSQANTWIRVRPRYPGEPTDARPKVWVERMPDGRPVFRPYSCHRGKDGTKILYAYNVLMWACWGPPPTDDHKEATHTMCDCHECLNPLHGRLGTRSDNLSEFHCLKRYKTALAALPPEERTHFSRWEHPCKELFDCQGFFDCSRAPPPPPKRKRA